MSLNKKALILIISISVCVTGILWGLLYLQLLKVQLGSVNQNVSTHLEDIAFSIDTFFEDVKADLNTLAQNELVRSPGDEELTSFLDADPVTFVYEYSETEQKIIDLFAAYRDHHRYANSVYMGRENGSFVRSHERAEPTRYDPRERPWYELAKRNPGLVLTTDAYASVTSPDVNIGVVTALLDDDGRCFGVVGIDVTIANLDAYMQHFRTSPPATLIVIDENGMVLSSQDPAIQAANIEESVPPIGSALARQTRGATHAVFDDGRSFFLYQAPTEIGWRIAALIPESAIRRYIRRTVAVLISGLALGLLVVGAFIVIGLNVLILSPLKQLTGETNEIARTLDLNRYIDIGSGDEIGILAESYNEMIKSLDTARRSLEQKDVELEHHQKHLEELVAERTAELEKANRQLKSEIAERIIVSQTLEEREAQYRNLVESANNIIIRWNPDGRIMFANRFAEHFFGYAQDEMIGVDLIGAIVSPREHDGAGVAELIEDIVARPEAHVRSVNENTRRNGDRVWVAWANKPIRGEDGGIIEILSIGVDITQLVLTEQELRTTLAELATAKEQAETADRLKSAFLATMSHELRTPLNSIIGFTGILLQGLVGPLNTEQEKQLGMVRSSAQHLLVLISDVLDISKIEAGQLTLARESVDVGALVEKVCSTMQPLADKKGLKIRMPRPADSITIESDSRRLEQILLNLIGNAVKFTEQGEVRVEYLRQDEEVLISVSDTGVGIDEAEIERIFEPFIQSDTGLTRRFEGTGLGLSICRKLVTMMGGRIWVESTRDKGSTFRFSLPIRRTAH